MNKRFGMLAVAVLAIVGVAFGGALTAERDTHQRSGEYVSMLAATNVTIYAGSMVCENGSQRAVPASDTSGYAVIGRAEETVDTVGDLTATKYVKVRRGVFLWANGDSFTDANVGDLAYVEDDQTVQKGASATYDIVAGVIIDVDSSGVWVDTYAIGGQGAASVTTLNASGAAVLGSTLSVAGAATLSAAATVGTTLGVTGVATFTATPKFTVTNAVGSVTASTLNNLPSGTTTNAFMWKITIGGNNYVVPAYRIP